METLIGTTDVTGGADNFWFNASVVATKRTCVASGTLEQLAMTIRDSSGDMQLKLAVWADGATPGALLGSTGLVATGSGAGGTHVADVLVPFDITVGQSYWLGFLSYGANLNSTFVNDTAGFTGRDLAGGTSTIPDPFGTPDFNDTEGLPIRGDGTESSGGGGGGEDVFARVGGEWVASNRVTRVNGAWV